MPIMAVHFPGGTLRLISSKKLKMKLTLFTAAAGSVPGAFNTAKRLPSGCSVKVDVGPTVGELAGRPELRLVGVERIAGSGVGDHHDLAVRLYDKKAPCRCATTWEQRRRRWKPATCRPGQGKAERTLRSFRIR